MAWHEKALKRCHMQYLTASNSDLHNSTALTCSVRAVQLTRGDAVTCSCGGSRNENQRRSPGGGGTHTHRGPLNALISMLNRSCILHHTHHVVPHTHNGMYTLHKPVYRTNVSDPLHNQDHDYRLAVVAISDTCTHTLAKQASGGSKVCWIILGDRCRVLCTGLLGDGLSSLFCQLADASRHTPSQLQLAQKLAHPAQLGFTSSS